MSEINTDDLDPEDAEEIVQQVADPEDYNQNQRLKDIHDSRRAVREALAEVERVEYRSEQKRAWRELSSAVSMYVMELQPLMDRVDHGIDLSLPEDAFGGAEDIHQFATMLGRIGNNMDDLGSAARPQKSMHVFRVCNQFVAEIGIGVTVDDGGDSWEV